MESGGGGIFQAEETIDAKAQERETGVVCSGDSRETCFPRAEGQGHGR